MKKLLLSFLAIVSMASVAMAQSQMLYGLASSGGLGGYAGTLYKMNSDGSGFNVVHNFQAPDGYMPMGNVIQASNGKLYGCCHEGGDWASCTIWCFNIGTNTYEDVWDFDITNGDFPKSGVVEGPDGKLWGAAHSGGSTYAGVIYSYNIGTDVYTAEHSFTSGRSPWSCPIFIGNILYGLTTDDTSSHAGVLYSYDISSNTYTELHHFNITDGSTPYGSLFKASNGKLYGMTSAGGTNGSGVVFSYDIGTTTYTKLHDFATIDGIAPHGGFAESASGKIYGMTMNGGVNNVGTIFSIDLTNNNFAKVHDFDETNGASPYGDLSFDATSGKFYGTTYLGGANNMGTTFTFNPTGNSFQKTFDFNGTLGSNPNGALSFATMLSGITSIDDEVLVNIYPNPVTDRFTISISEPVTGKVVFNLHDAEGKVVMSWRENITAGNYTKVVDINHLPSGAYTLEINNGEMKTVKKILK